MIDKETVDRIKNTANIVDIVSDYVKLTRRGANYMGLCPFHNERTPSFSVNVAKNFCYCFSCHKGGSPVNFIMEKEGISYQDALRQIARRYGITIEERELTAEEQKAHSEREAMYVANEWALKVMTSYLHDDDEGRNVGLQYLYSRQVTPEAVKAFDLGYLPDRNVLEERAAKEGFDKDVLMALGLLGQRQQGRMYDRFRGRVMFPVRNSAGKVVAFGGRDIKGVSPAKYINSPESPVYKKSNELYGMYNARQAIVKENKCYLVEGYLDVIGMWQAGVKNVVASSGTALTDQQIALIHRFTPNVTLIYDGDNAGIKASLRGIDLLLSHNLNIKVLLLPEGHDPDSFARANTPEAFREYLDAHEVDFITYKARALLQGRNMADPQAIASVANEMVVSLACIADKVSRSIYVKECSHMLNVDEQSLKYAVDRRRQQVVTEQRLSRERETARQMQQPQTHQDAAPTPQMTGADKQDDADMHRTSAPAALSAAQLADKKTRQRMDVETRLMRYCVRYGMMSIAISEDDDNQSEGYVVDIIRDELASDSIDLLKPENRKLFAALEECKTSFEDDYAAFCTRCDADDEAEFQQLVRDEGLQSGSPEDIELMEHRLRQRVEMNSSVKRRDYAANYLFSRMVNHEDDEIRTYAGQLATEPYELSKIYEKTGKVEHEIDRVAELVPRTLNELRAQLVECEYDALRKSLSKAPAEEQLHILGKMQELAEVRKAFSEVVGGRIVHPK